MSVCLCVFMYMFAATQEIIMFRYSLSFFLGGGVFFFNENCLREEQKFLRGLWDDRKKKKILSILFSYYSGKYTSWMLLLWKKYIYPGHKLRKFLVKISNWYMFNLIINQKLCIMFKCIYCLFLQIFKKKCVK